MNQNGNNYDHLIKLVLIGDANVGKSSLVFRCVDKTYSDRYLSTIGLDYKIKQINLDGKRIKICIWDTAGQEKFRAITAGYYRDAHGIIVVYDITNQKSFNHVKLWMEEIQKRADKNVHVLLVGNKCDLIDEREVFYETGKTFAEEMKVPFLETSAKDAINVELAVYTMAAEIKAKLIKDNADKAKAKKLKAAKNNTSLNCCSVA